MVAELSAKTLCRSKNNSSDLEGNAAGASNQKSSVATDGKIMNLLTADLERLSKLCKYLDQIFSYSLSLGIGVWYMYQLLGVSALFGLSLTAVYIPLSKLMLARLAYSEKMVNVVSDKRISMITELVQGIKTVKLFGWEAHFLKNINNQREYQLIYLWKNALWRLFIKAIVMLGPMLIIIVMFATHVAVLGKELTAEIAFTTISVYQLVRFIFENFPTYVSLGINGYVSIGRIDSYLGQSEIQELEERVIQGPVVALGFQSADLEWESTEDSTDFSKDDTYGLPGTAFASLSEARTEIGTPGVENVDCNHQLNENTPLLMESFSCSDVGLFSSSSKATLSHNVNMDGFSLKNIDVQFPIGGFTIVAGPTGSGKSSLLSALIGEMALTRGHILLPTAYSSDAAASESKYRDIVELSNEGLAIRDIAYVAQESWLRNATIRENILFGEVYEKERYEEVLRVCALKPDLRILAAGDMTEIGERGIALSGGQKQRISLARAVYSSHRILLIDDCLSAVDSHTAKHILMECLVGNTSLIQGRTRVLVTHHVAMCLPYVNYMVMMHEGRITLKGAPSDLQSQGSLSMVLADLESSESDIVSHKGKNAIEKQATKVCRGKYFEGISDDSEDADQDDDAVEKDKLANSVNNTKSEDEYNAERLCKINAQRGLGPSSDISALQGTIVKEEEREEGYVKFERQHLAFIHSQLLQTIVHATPRFFDSTPFGRIINRFSRDMQIIDEGTLDTIIAWFADVFAVLGVFVIATMAIPVFIFVALAVLLIYTVIAYYYLNASREIKRLESNSMSPLLSLFGELLEGVSTIRAFGVKKYYIKEAINRIETHNRLFHTLWLTIRWLTARIHIASSIVSFTCALLIIMSRDWMDAGLAGFVLSYALSFSRRMIWVVLNYSNNEINMNAVERVIQYLDVEQEAAMESDPENKPFALWPRKGDVRIENLVVEYAPGVPVLHDISLSVKHGEKIGVVGRTGAGKSTMSLALLRFIEASKGRIILDDVDISKIGLEDLRRNVTIIPQDPVLFNGTIRFNLDPFGEHPDELLWDALKRTHLVRERESQTNNTTASIIEDIGGADGDLLMLECMTGIFISLDAEIKENGQILSLGQRQLVALARALVRRSKLIIMDEATASVDFDTDDRIQRTIRGPEFANSTLFCIAHRLRTIIDYDRILVLDKGKVAEFDTPHNLLQNENGIFRSMCEKSGEYEHLSIAAASGY
ncbi:hypothetical protein LPJ74_002369 [Coemansia sp. RSA 1843]|nr:hypothetical protein LPJ74_002369 [Coemansia sp. RSA 1843]